MSSYGIKKCQPQNVPSKWRKENGKISKFDPQKFIDIFRQFHISWIPSIPQFSQIFMRELICYLQFINEKQIAQMIIGWQIYINYSKSNYTNQGVEWHIVRALSLYSMSDESSDKMRLAPTRKKCLLSFFIYFPDMSRQANFFPYDISQKTPAGIVEHRI